MSESLSDIVAAKDRAEALVAKYRRALEPSGANVLELAKKLHAAWDGRPDPWPWRKMSPGEKEVWRRHAEVALRALQPAEEEGAIPVDEESSRFACGRTWGRGGEHVCILDVEGHGDLCVCHCRYSSKLLAPPPTPGDQS